MLKFVCCGADDVFVWLNPAHVTAVRSGKSSDKDEQYARIYTVDSSSGQDYWTVKGAPEEIADRVGQAL